MKFLDFHGLQVTLWKYFIFFSASVLVILWLLQIIFFTAYYEQMKTIEVENIGKQIVTYYGQEDFEENAYQSSFKNGVAITIVDKNGNPLQKANVFEMRNPRLRREMQQIPIIIDKINFNSNKPISYTLKDENSHNLIIVYGAKLINSAGEVNYLILNAPLSPMNATVNVLKSQLLIVTIASLLFSFFLSYFIARRLATPIMKITKAASILAKGNYNVHFERGSYNEINQLADALNHTTKELSKTDELRRDLIANVSHDLRTPLTIIKSYAEMIRDISGENKEKRNSHLNVIVDETDRLSTFVTDILDLSKMESNTVILEMKPFDFAKTVRSIYEGLKVFYENRNYNFTMNCPNSVMVLGDYQKISQVIYNLLGNAINYTGEDNVVKVNVTTTNDKVRFEVIDTGSGIPPEEIERVWERYYKSANTNKRESKGSGIGLAIVKNLLELHHAEYGIISKIDQGSTFWFELPTIS